MRPAPETGNELPPFLSGGLTYPEEEKDSLQEKGTGNTYYLQPGQQYEAFYRDERK